MRCLTGKLAVLSLAGLMGTMIPMSALAASPEFAYSDETWETLKDNILEYGELADLIHEYNVTVQNNQYEQNEFIKKYGKTREDIARKYREKANDLESSMSGEDGMGMVSDFQMQIQADNLREQADDMVEDSSIYALSYRMTEDTLVKSAQSRFLAYYRNQLELTSAREKQKTLESAYTLTEAKRQAGMATEAEVLSAREAVREQEKTVSDLEQQVENTRQTLIVMCGWKESDQPEIREVPQIDLAELDAMDPEADKQTALEKNYTLQMNQKRLANAQDASKKENYQKKIDANEKQIGVSITNAWQNLQTARRSYELAVSSQAAGEQDFALAGQKWNAGLITKYEYEKAQAEYTSKKNAVQTAYLDLLEALEAYRWDVNGLAGAE